MAVTPPFQETRMEVVAWAMQLANQQPIASRPLRRQSFVVPELLADQVLLDVSACGVCRTDLHVVEGDLKAHRSPLIPGHQVVGRVLACGSNVRSLRVGQRVGAAWLRSTCGVCRFCLSERENLCESAAFNGWTADGGYATRMVAPAEFLYQLPEAIADIDAAPLLCAGIIGYRALRLTGIDSRGGGWDGARLGIYGFGAAGHIAIQLAVARGAAVYVCTRDRSRHQALAEELGAHWVGGTFDRPPVPLDAAIIFAPAGELVPVGLAALDKGGCLVCGGIHMSEIPAFGYERLYGERTLRSVANNTRQDGHEFLAEAAQVGVRTRVQIFPLEAANEALLALKSDAIKGAAVLVCEGLVDGDSK
jgi:propanol-preferring alcohol dehydrogenase